MLTVACIETGNYEGRGEEYVRRLKDAVEAHLPVRHRFVCITDRPAYEPIKDVDGEDVDTDMHDSGFPGWWQKVSLFAPGRFTEGRVLYFDLDTIIRGDLSPLAGYSGEYATLRDVWRPELGQTAVVAWRAGYGGHICDAALERLRDHGLDPKDRADPLISRLTPDREHLQDLFPGMFKSYKAEARDHGPGNAAVIFCHGRPRPHELPEEGWARRAWEAMGA